MLVGPPRTGKTTLVKNIPPDFYATTEQEIEAHLDTLQGICVLDRNTRIYLSRGLDCKLGAEAKNVMLVLVGTKPGIDVYFTCRTVGLVPGQDFDLTQENILRFWRRGGLPESFFAETEDASERFLRKYRDFYNVEEMSRLWNRQPLPADSQREYEIPWDSGLYHQGGLISDAQELFPYSNLERQPSWETCVLRVIEGGLRLLDPRVKIFRKVLRGYHLFVISSGSFQIAVVPTLKSDLKYFPLKSLQSFLQRENISRGCVVRPEGALIREENNILIGSLHETIGDLRKSLNLKE